MTKIERDLANDPLLKPVWEECKKANGMEDLSVEKWMEKALTPWLPYSAVTQQLTFPGFVTPELRRLLSWTRACLGTRIIPRAIDYSLLGIRDGVNTATRVFCFKGTLVVDGMTITWADNNSLTLEIDRLCRNQGDFSKYFAGAKGETPEAPATPEPEEPPSGVTIEVSCRRVVYGTASYTEVQNGFINVSLPQELVNRLQAGNVTLEEALGEGGVDLYELEFDETDNEGEELTETEQSGVESIEPQQWCMS